MNSRKDKKIIIGLFSAFAVLVLLYFAQNAYADSTGKLETEYALKYTQQEKLQVTGFAVRDENRMSGKKNISVLVESSDKVYVPVVSDSANVGKNDVIVITFSDEKQAENYIRVRELREKLADLENLKSQGTLNYVNVIYLNSRIYASVDDYVDSINSKNLSSLNDSYADFVSKMSMKQIATGDSFDIDSQIKELKSEIKSLEKTYKSANEVKSPYAGYFVSRVDGYESVKSYNDAKNKVVSVNEGNTLINSKKSEVENAYGKIIGQHTWYFIFDTSITDASVIKTGYYVSVDFPDRDLYDLTMKVHNVSELKGDTITVTLECTSMNEELADLRIENAAITVKDYEGFRISSNAIIENEEGLRGVYVILGNFIRFTPVDIIYYGDGYVIANKYAAYKEDENGKKVVDEEKTSKYRSIRLYDQIIVKGVNIEDGKVID